MSQFLDAVNLVHPASKNLSQLCRKDLFRNRCGERIKKQLV